MIQVLFSTWLCLSGIAGGGQAVLAYSGGAKDLSGISWAAMSDGHFAVPAFAESFSYDRSGLVKGIGDASGSRSLGYLRGRLESTNWTAGALRGYKVERGIDATGRGTGFTLRRDGVDIHTVSRGYTGVSDQVAGLASGALMVLPQRDAQGRLTGYQWGSASGTFIPRVTQTWSRGAGGRIEAAQSNVTGAPSFDYFIDGQPLATSFDNRDRHLKCQTAGGTWTYAYDSSGQLSSATRSGTSPVTFSYGFDGVGRRSDKGTGNTSDLLNRTVAWNNSQAKTLRIDADPAAQVSVNGTAITGFTGSYTLPLTSPGPQGGWVPWTTLAVLPGQGEGAGSPALNPLASPDAKAQKSGATWIPPVNETFHYDPAGNRLDSAQWEYGWDAKDQLVCARTKDWQTAPQGWDLRFAYDSEGRRFRKEVTRYAAGAVVGQKTVTYVWDGWDIVYERQQLSSGLTILERKYLWGEGLTGSGREMNPGGLLLIRESKGDSSVDLIPLYDGTGHVVALSSIKNDGTAELQASYAYGPFGEPMGATGPRAAGNPWRYATKYLDEETGLYYFGHRYYDPVTGQWLNREPLGESESINLYSYCHNDPVNKVDVLGFGEKGLWGKFLDWTLIFGSLDPIELPEAPASRKAREERAQRRFDEMLFIERYAKGELNEFDQAYFDFVLAEHAAAVRTAEIYGSVREGTGLPVAEPAKMEVVDMAALSIGSISSTPLDAEMNAAFVFPMGAGNWALQAVRGIEVLGLTRVAASFQQSRLILGVGAEMRVGTLAANSSARDVAQMARFFESPQFAGLSAEAKEAVANGRRAIPYNPRLQRILYEDGVSTTVPPLSGKNVRLAGQRHPITGIVFDIRGYPIFDDVAMYDTTIDNIVFRASSYTEQMQLATQDLWSKIQSGVVPRSRFSSIQLEQIQKGAAKIEGFTWHHHQNTGRMQLIPFDIHSKTGHLGWEAISKGL